MNGYETTSSSETQAAQAQSFFLAAVIGVILAGLFSLRLLPTRPQTCLTLAGEINPNTAPLPSLVRLPGIGPGRAEAIISLRQSGLAADGNHAFSEPNDLQLVHGIGPKTARRISGSVTFEGDR